MGGNLAYKKHGLRLSATAVTVHYNKPLNKKATIANQYDFRGTQNSIIGGEFNYSINIFNIYGEAGRSANGGLGGVIGSVISFDSKLTMLVHYRNFARDYQTIYSNAMVEGSGTQNERGMYVGAIIKPTYKWAIQTFYDSFMFPWIGITASSPNAKGNDFFAQVTYLPKDRVTIYGRYRHRNKVKNAPTSIEEMDFLLGTEQENYRIEASYPVSRSVTFKQRIEAVNYAPAEGTKETGYVFFTDVSYRAPKTPFTLTGRYAIFDTDGYNSRIYTYEKEVLYAFSVPGLSGVGSRMYLLTKYSPTRNIDLWLRYSTTIWDNVTTNGSGLNLINAPSKSEFGIQLRLKL
jgi:hypothetical protein